MNSRPFSRDADDLLAFKLEEDFNKNYQPLGMHMKPTPSWKFSLS